MGLGWDYLRQFEGLTDGAEDDDGCASRHDFLAQEAVVGKTGQYIVHGQWADETTRLTWTSQGRYAR